MRPLDTETLEHVDFLESEATPVRYAILSHTWGEGEILFSDIQRGRSYLLGCGKPALEKVLSAARVARKNWYNYIWIDTYCIDKSSSAELSEVINSIFAWYVRAAVCYTYLSDFPFEDPARLSEIYR